MTHRKLQHFIQQFLMEEPDSFSMKEFLSQAGKSGLSFTGDDKKKIIVSLIQSGYLTENNDFFVHPSKAFVDFELKIQLTELEKNRNILIPGHRFIPLLNSSDNPWSCLLSDRGNGTALPVKRELFSWGELEVFFAFFDQRRILRYLDLEDPENLQRYLENDGSPETEITLTVFDLTPWKETLNSSAIDGLLVQWRGGYKLDFTIKALSPSENNLVDFSRKRQFITSLDAVLEELAADYGSALNAEDQIAQALYRIRGSFSRNPPLHIGGYLDESREIGLFGSGENSLLWPKNSGMPPWESREQNSELDVLLSRLDIALCEDEIEAFIRDEFFSGTPDKTRMTGRCFGNRKLNFSDQKENVRFHTLMDELWEEVEDVYSFEEDAHTGPLRHRILEMQEEQLLFIRSLDAISRDITPIEDPLMELSQISSMMGTVLATLNTDQIGSPAGVQNHLEDLDVMLKDMEHSQTRLIDDMKAVLEKNMSPSRKQTRKTGNTKSRIYQLKITLKGSRPPVWRRISIPGDCSLADLHQVIQISMGWQDYHLHEFLINGIRYDDPESHDEFDPWDEPALSESTALLQKLKLKEGNKFSYVYDFGDSWIHDILVEKIMASGESSSREEQNVVCLKASKPCPPEDCGGLHGYYHALWVLEDPENPEYDDILDWKDELLNQESADLNRINKELRRLFN